MTGDRKGVMIGANTTLHLHEWTATIGADTLDTPLIGLYKQTVHLASCCETVSCATPGVETSFPIKTSLE
jgi:hypothetical protein